jgi:CRISPR-associated protein Csx14
MASATIPVDLRNPGQVFACLGFMEAAEILCGPCKGGFDYQDGAIITTFSIDTEGSDDPVAAVLRFLAGAEAKALVPNGSNFSVNQWGLATKEVDAHCFPSQIPKDDKPAMLPMILTDGAKQVPIDYWAHGSATGLDNFKLWGGSGGKPGAAFACDDLQVLRDIGPNALGDLAGDPFSFSSPRTSSLRFDQGYDALNAGFALNDHKNFMRVTGYPILDLLAAVGLQNARPQRPDPGDKLAYRYGISNLPLPTAYARVVLSAQPLWQHPLRSFPMRIFRMQLEWSNQEGKDRYIKDVQEEFEP